MLQSPTRESLSFPQQMANDGLEKKSFGDGG
jgi:hypothetical protein